MVGHGWPLKATKWEPMRCRTNFPCCDISRCQNGLLVDVSDLEALQDSLESAGKSYSQWNTWSNNGVEAITRYFSWDAHVCNYIAFMQKRVQNVASRSWTMQKNTSQNSLTQKLLLLDLDNNLEQSDAQALINLRKRLKDYSLQSNFRLGIITGRSIKAAKYQYSQLNLPFPSVWICRAGTEIFYDNEEKSDILWQDLISMDWDREAQAGPRYRRHFGQEAIWLARSC